MSARVVIETIEPLSHRWARLDRYTIAYTRRDGVTERLFREVHDHGHGACVLPYDAARGTVLLVRQFRLPVHLNTDDGFIIEVCAGLLDGDDPALSQESGDDSGGGGTDGLFGWSGLFRCLNQRSHTNQNTRETKETRHTRETKYTR